MSVPGGTVHGDVLSEQQAHPIKKRMTQMKQFSPLHPYSILSLTFPVLLRDKTDLDKDFQDV